MGETLQLTTVGLDVNGVTVASAKIMYRAAPTSVISVNASGLVTGVAPATGSVTEMERGRASPPVSVTVN